MLWDAFTLALYGFLCSSEYLILQWLDISCNNRITINLRQSKIDTFLKNQKSMYVRMYIQPTHPLAHAAAQAFLLHMPFSNSTTASDPVFMAGRFAPLTQASLNKALHTLLSRTALNQSQYASHSFRIGAATTTATEKIPVWMLKSLGLWISNAYLSYIQRSPLSTLAITELMARTDAANQPLRNGDEYTLN